MRKRIVYKDGTSKVVNAINAWEYENDSDWDHTEEVDPSDPEGVEA